MKTLLSRTTSVCLLLFSPLVYADLPELEGKAWIGCFAGYKDRKVRFTIDTTGGMLIEPIYDGGNPRAYIKMPVTCGLEVTMPNGKKRIMEFLPESLETDDRGTTEFEATTIRGQFEGDAAFEIMIQQKRGVVSIGGRITAPGTYKPDAIRIHVSAQILNFYGRKKQELKNDPAAFEQLVSQDYVKLKWTNGKKHELDFIEPRNLATEDVNGPGVEEAEVSIKSIDRKFIYEATGNSALTLSNRKNAPLSEGMKMNWSPDAGKDPKAEARLVITVK
jgi:hypothetical protein